MTTASGSAPADSCGGRTLADLAATDAPVDPRRAAAIALAIAESALSRAPRITAPDQLGADRIRLEPPDTIRLDPADPDDDFDPVTADGAAGAAIGRAYHLLLVGRVPGSSADAFEPYLLRTVTPSQCALMSRSCSPTPTQWPRVDEWADELAVFCGGSRLDLPPHRLRAQRRARIAAVAALVLVVLATAAALLLAPRWLEWSDQGAPMTGRPQPTDQRPLPSEMSY